MSTEGLAIAKKRVFDTYTTLCGRTGYFPRMKLVEYELAKHMNEVAEKAKDEEVTDFDPHKIANKMQSALELDVEDWLSARHNHEIAQKEYSRLKEAAEKAREKTQKPAKKKARKDSE
jgi:hypothetical protein